MKLYKIRVHDTFGGGGYHMLYQFMFLGGLEEKGIFCATTLSKRLYNKTNAVNLLTALPNNW